MTQAQDWHRVNPAPQKETEKIHATVEVSEGELAVGGGRVGGQDQRQEERCPSCAFPHDLDSYRDYAEMDATGEWEFVKAGRLRAICFWKASHALGGSTLRRCSKCQGIHNGSLHYSIMPQDNREDNSVPIAAYNVDIQQLNLSPEHWASTPQRTDDSVRSKTPPHFDLHAVRVVEVLNRTNADYVDVNIIGDTNATSKHGGLGSEVELGTRPVESELDTKDGVLLMTADVNTCNLYPDSEDNDELNPSSKRWASAPQGTDNGI